MWLAALNESGPDITSDDLAVAWLEHLDYSDEECGYAALNLRRGLPPPASGAFSNWFRGGTRGMMRADLWGLLCPGAPQTAAGYAYHDSILDHSEEGEWAAMFLPPLQRRVFHTRFAHPDYDWPCHDSENVPDRPRRENRACRRAAGRIVAGSAGNVIHEVGNKNFSDAPQNMGFFTIGLFYGMGDFGNSLCAGVNCGYDSEAVGGALGALLGIRMDAQDCRKSGCVLSAM